MIVSTVRGRIAGLLACEDIKKDLPDLSPPPAHPIHTTSSSSMETETLGVYSLDSVGNG